MSKIVKIVATELGADIQSVDIYHTSITASNLISSSVTASVITTTGVTFEVEDNVTEFLAFCSGGACFGTSGSISVSVYSPTTRHFHIITSGSDEGGSVSMTYPYTIGPTTSSFTASVNYSLYTTATIVATGQTYPDDQFRGWYYSTNRNTPFSTSATLTLTDSTYTTSDTIYAFFSDD